MYKDRNNISSEELASILEHAKKVGAEKGWKNTSPDTQESVAEFMEERKPNQGKKLSQSVAKKEAITQLKSTSKGGTK